MMPPGRRTRRHSRTILGIALNAHLVGKSQNDREDRIIENSKLDEKDGQLNEEACITFDGCLVEYDMGHDQIERIVRIQLAQILSRGLLEMDILILAGN